MEHGAEGIEPISTVLFNKLSYSPLRVLLVLEIISPGFWLWQSSKVFFLQLLFMLAYINHVTNFTLGLTHLFLV